MVSNLEGIGSCFVVPPLRPVCLAAPLIACFSSPQQRAVVDKIALKVKPASDLTVQKVFYAQRSWSLTELKRTINTLFAKHGFTEFTPDGDVRVPVRAFAFKGAGCVAP